MTLALAGLPLFRREPREGVRWGTSLVAALALHALLGFYLWNWHQAPPPPPPASLNVTMIDLEPAPAPPQPVAPPQPIVPPQAVMPPQAVVEPPPVEKPPEAKPEVKPLPKPKPKPEPVQRHAVVRPVPVPLPSEAPPAPAETSPPAPPAAPPPAPARAPSNAVASFRDLLAAHLARYKRYPAAAQRKGEEGVAMVHFALDHQGHVSGIRIERSSGHALLDDEVLALLRRAQPLPPLPQDIAAAQLEFDEPVQFSLRDAR
jgi:protein TonB